MQVVHYQIEDFDEVDLKAKLVDAARTLNDMINNKGLKVYVQGTSGIGRAPAVVMAYLCLFKKVDFWSDVNVVEQFLKQYR